MRVLDLFSGIGGFALGLERAGMTTVAFCEINPYCRDVLLKNWLEVPCYADVKEVTAQRLVSDAITAEVICGGFPCQDISVAGRGAGIREGTRSGLWYEYARIIGELRPRYVIVENVAALLTRGMDIVLGDLAALGYDAEWDCISAADAGMPHFRDRVWIVAYPSGTREIGLVTGIDPRAARPRWMRGTEDMRAVASAPFEQCSRWPQPLLRGVDDGLSGRVDRIGALGNSIVPQIAEAIGRSIMRS